MAKPEIIKKTFERNRKAVKLRPSFGQTTGESTVRVHDGTTCEIEGSGWKLTADVGEDGGGNNAGPGPGVLERAAIGSCLAIGYATWAAHLEIPLEQLQVKVETDFDARGMMGIGERSPGFSEIRYQVIVKSPAPEEEVRRMIETADAHSSVLDDFTRPIPVKREIDIQTLQD